MTDYGELVKALRATERICRDRMDGQVMLDAAAAIEALQAELIRIYKQLPKQGEWKEWDEDTWSCSVCGEPWTLISGTPRNNGMNYCPNCGAKMEVQDD